MTYILEKYKGKWAVLDTKTCVWFFIGCGKAYCQKKCKELNEIQEKFKKLHNK